MLKQTLFTKIRQEETNSTINHIRVTINELGLPQVRKKIDTVITIAIIAKVIIITITISTRIVMTISKAKAAAIIISTNIIIRIRKRKRSKLLLLVFLLRKKLKSLMISKKKYSTTVSGRKWGVRNRKESLITTRRAMGERTQRGEELKRRRRKRLRPRNRTGTRSRRKVHLKRASLLEWDHKIQRGVHKVVYKVQ